MSDYVQVLSMSVDESVIHVYVLYTEKALTTPCNRPKPRSAILAYSSRITVWWQVQVWLPVVVARFWLLKAGVRRSAVSI